MIAALMILGAAGAAATTPAPATSPPAAPAAQTLQQRFDKGMELALSGDCVNAVPMFEALKPERAFKAGTLGGSMVLVHEGRCLVRIGLYDLGESYIEQGLPALRKAGDQFSVDIAGSLVSLGDAALARWENARAKTLYAQALAMGVDAIDIITINARLARATAFDGGPEPLRYADEAFRLAEADPKMPKDQLAALHIIRGRILMNQGSDKAAYTELKRALTLSGGLDLKVNLSDIALRSDLAVAAQLTGDQTGAREYLAYTGAGRLKEKNLGSAMSMEPPVCGSESGLRPEDFAIVEVAIGDDGRVIRAETTYTRGTAQVAAQFARAASNWVWDADAIKATPPVFRRAAHIEVRCTTLGQEVPGLTTPFDERFTGWAARTLGVDLPALRAEGTGALLNRLKTLAEQENVSADPLKKTAVNGWLISLQPISATEYDRRLTETIAAARSANAPQDVINWLRVKQIYTRVLISEWVKEMPRTRMPDLLAMLDEPELASDALTSDTIKLLAGSERDGRRQTPQWPELLKQVADDGRLPQHHPLRQLANLSLANDAAKRQAFAEADGYFKATGLTEEQCALIGPKPIMKKVGLSSVDYPVEAMVVDFEGWLRLEFDILADGKTAGVRPIIAYPPFIFNRASVDGLRDSRFEPSYRPTGGTACSASRQGVSFKLPG